ncbi:MAG: hypothetical protein JXQ93_14080, partial [Flavobacteriaceae bacterium]
NLEPDKFMFNANGTGGSFIFDYKTLKPVLQQYGDVKITHFMASGEIDRFEVIDANGITYYFGKSKDGTRVAKNKDHVLINYAYHSVNGVSQTSGGGVDGPFPNAWQLMDIEALDGSLIEFHYEKEEMTYFRRSKDEKDGSTSNVTMFSSKIRSDQYHIKEIIFNKEPITNKSSKVKFVKTTANRQDITVSGSHTLDYIEVLDRNDSIIKKVQLSYEYKTATTNGNEHPFFLTNDANGTKRLYLKTVKQVDTNGNDLPGHSFTYSSEELPSRFSNSQDAWGYYNGASNGHYLTFFNYNTNPVNRTVDTLKSEAGMLQKITYPTGGSTNLIYEHNRAIPSVDMKQVVVGSINPIVSRNENLSQLNYAFDYNNSTNQYEKTVVINHIYNNEVDVDITFQDTNGCTRDEPACKFDISFVGNGYNIALYLGANTTLGNLPAGTYTLIVKPKFNPYVYTDPNQGFSVQMNWLEHEDDQPDFLYTSGKRIKRIEFKDSDNSLVSFKEYEYLKSDGVTTSGKLFGLPNFLSIRKSQTIGGAILLQYNGSTTIGPLSAPQGNTTGYEYVTEYYGEKNNNVGKTEYEFTAFNDDGEWYKYPYHLPLDNEWLRGKPLETKHYKNTNGTYSLVKEVENTYLYANLITSLANLSVLTVANIPKATDFSTVSSLSHNKDEEKYRIPFIKIFHEEGADGTPSQMNPIVYKVYHLTGGTQNLHKTTTKDYYGGGIVHTTTTTNSYDYTKHYQQKGSKMTDSNGDVIETINYYPIDVGNVNSLGLRALTTLEYNAIHKLKAPTTGNPTGIHRIATPVQVETYNGTTLLSTVRTNFIDTLGQILPRNVETLKGTYNATSNPLEERIVYDSYYANGNVQQVRKKDGTPIVYIWGYNHTVPIAKIENATYSDIPTSIYNSIINASNADNDRTQGSSGNEGALRAELAKLRSTSLSPNLINAQVTSFTYDPLIGVTSITDPRGRTMYYVYDSFNRLEYVKDHDGNTLSKNEYHYKN